MSAQTDSCPQCHTPLPSDAPKGLCPECLLRGGFESADEAEASQPTGVARDDTAPIVVPLDESGAVPEALRHFGDYELLEQIAVGGMGVVFKARQVSLNRLVAVKMIRSGQLAREGDIRRFRTEAEAAANLKHPHIVAIHEVGEHEGRQYYSMDFIEGRSLAELVRDRPLEPARAASLVQTVAEAIAYAHGRGVLHRDLKPSNVMLDAQDQPHVTDFGLAKLLTNPERETRNSEQTQSGAVMGSPSYMSPEQARGRGDQVSVRSDVYALGAMLYELLTSRPPFLAATPLETMKLVAESEPVGPRALNPSVPRDLETICLKCLQKEPAHRYASAEALAEDLARWQRHEPIRARPSSVLEQAVKWARRHPARAGLVGLSLIAPAVIIAVLLVTGALVTHERNNALRQESRATNALARVEAEAQRADDARAETRQNLYAADMLLAQHALDDGNLGLARRLVLAWQPQAMTSEDHRMTNAASWATRNPKLETRNLRDLRGFEWRYLWQQCQGDQVRTLHGHSNAVNCVAFSPDGQTLVSCDEDSNITLWAAGSGDILGSWSQRGDSIQCVSFSPDGQWLVTGERGGVIRLWNIASQKGTWYFKGHKPVRARFAGPFLAVYVKGSAPYNPLKLFDWATGREVRTWPVPADLEDVSRDGKTLVTSRSDRQQIDLWDLKTGDHFHTWTNSPASLLALSPDGQTLAMYFHAPKAIQLCDAAGVRPITWLRGHTGAILAMEFSPDGRLFATGSADQSLRLWDVATQREAACLRGNESYVNGLAFSPDGKMIATAGRDRTVRLWRVEIKPPTGSMTKVFPPFILSPDGATLAAGTGVKNGAPHMQILLCDLKREKSEVLLAAGFAKPVFFSTNGQNLATLDTNAAGLLALTFWNLADKSVQSTLPLFEGRLDRVSVAVTADRQAIAINHDKVITLRSTTTGKTFGVLPTFQKHDVSQLTFSPDGQTLAAFYYQWLGENFLVLWNVATRTERARLSTSATDFYFSPDSRLLAAGVNDHTLRLWETATAREWATLAGHQSSAVGSPSFSPDGMTLASVAGDEMKLWNVASRREVATCLKGQASLRFCAFTGDGQSLVTVGGDGIVRILRAPTLAEIDRQP